MKNLITFLGSAKFAIILIILIVILSMLGSLVPQGDGQAIMDKLSSIFGADAAAVHNFLINTGLIDIYSSIPFIILVSLFGINIIICTIKLFPFAKSGFDNENIKLKETSQVNMSESDFIQKLSKLGFRGQKNGDTYKAVSHEKGRYGVIILHFGIIIVLLGALIGRIAGFNGFMNILEGDFDDVAVLPTGELVPLGFEVKCNDFTVEYYQNSNRAKSYTSNISIIENGKEVENVNIDVNKPLEYNGIYFYQTNFGVYPNKNAKVKLTIDKKDGDKIHKLVNFNELFIIDGEFVAKIVDFAPTLSQNEEGKIFSSSDEMNNPAVLIEVYKVDEPIVRGWLLQKYPDRGKIDELGINIIFNDLYGIEYTGLSVKKDPGTPVVYIGFIFIIFGLIFIYCLNYTAIYFKFSDDNGKLIINYSILEQRKFSFINPSKSFKKLLNG